MEILESSCNEIRSLTLLSPWVRFGQGSISTQISCHLRQFGGLGKTHGFQTLVAAQAAKKGEGTLLPFHGRICGCPDAWAFSWGPCAIKVYR